MNTVTESLSIYIFTRDKTKSNKCTEDNKMVFNKKKNLKERKNKNQLGSLRYKKKKNYKHN